VAVRHMASPTVTEDEIANAAGMGDENIYIYVFIYIYAIF
jgi:hypothetical protein